MKLIWAICLILFVLSGCDEKNSSAEKCGDGIVDPGEECDGLNLDGHRCEEYGYHGGTLSCTDSCTISTGLCSGSGVCGDGTIQPDNGEECESGDLNGATCFSLGYYGGALSCSESCLFDESDCASYGSCGDGIIQEGNGEECENGELGEATCVTDRKSVG